MTKTYRKLSEVKPVERVLYCPGCNEIFIDDTNDCRKPFGYLCPNGCRYELEVILTSDNHIYTTRREELYE